jgi:hypothetical protein
MINPPLPLHQSLSTIAAESVPAMEANKDGSFPASQEELNKNELRKIRRLKAENYRNRYLLPRFVLEENGTRRKLEPGEYDPNSQLYPITTPIAELSDFGALSSGPLFFWVFFGFSRCSDRPGCVCGL